MYIKNVLEFVYYIYIQNTLDEIGGCGAGFCASVSGGYRSVRARQRRGCMHGVARDVRVYAV